MQENIGTDLVITSAGPSFAVPDPTPDSSSDHDRTVFELPECSERLIINHDEEEEDDDDFEFTFNHDSDWFPSGEVFPIFDRRLLSESDANAIESDQLRTVRSALKKLFIVGDRNTNNRNSEDEDHTELIGVSPGTYCVWTPGNSPQASPARCKKSSSTGTSTTKRWGESLKELLIRRSRSDGKRSLVRFGSWKKMSDVKKNDDTTAAAAVDVKRETAGNGGGEKRRSTYLPYRKAIIGFGFYPSVNGFGGVNRNRPPF